MKFKIIIILLAGIMIGAIAFSNTPSNAQKKTDSQTYEVEFEQALLAKTNALRASKGLPALQPSSAMKSKARSWSIKMMGDVKASHSNVYPYNPADWIRAGENVGIADNVDQALQMLIDSPTHYANLIDPEFTNMDVGAVLYNSNKYFFAQEFVQLPAPTTLPPETPTTAIKDVKADTTPTKKGCEK